MVVTQKSGDGAHEPFPMVMHIIFHKSFAKVNQATPDSRERKQIALLDEGSGKVSVEDASVDTIPTMQW